MYRNDGGVFVEFENLLPALRLVSATWGDYDNDGDLDVHAGWG